MPALRERFALGALALIAVVALSLGAMACGDSDDSGGDADQSQQSSGEAQIRETVATVHEAFKTRDVKTICDAMAPKAQAQVKSAEDYPTCEKGLYDALTADATGEARTIGNPERPRITAVQIGERRAVVRARQGSHQTTASFEKAGGEWKLASWFR